MTTSSSKKNIKSILKNQTPHHHQQEQGKEEETESIIIRSLDSSFSSSPSTSPPSFIATSNFHHSSPEEQPVDDQSGEEVEELKTRVQETTTNDHQQHLHHSSITGGGVNEIKKGKEEESKEEQKEKDHHNQREEDFDDISQQQEPQSGLYWDFQEAIETDNRPLIDDHPTDASSHNDSSPCLTRSGSISGEAASTQEQEINSSTLEPQTGVITLVDHESSFSGGAILNPQKPASSLQGVRCSEEEELNEKLQNPNRDLKIQKLKEEELLNIPRSSSPDRDLLSEEEEVKKTNSFIKDSPLLLEILEDPIIRSVGAADTSGTETSSAESPEVCLKKSLKGEEVEENVPQPILDLSTSTSDQQQNSINNNHPNHTDADTHLRLEESKKDHPFSLLSIDFRFISFLFFIKDCVEVSQMRGTCNNQK